MSYCRWSSDDFRCDLYCYEDVAGGWTTHVAGNRILGDIPHEDWKLLATGRTEDAKEFMRQHRAQSDFLKTAQRAPIGLPHDGQSFNDPTLEAFRARVVALREMGYRCPDYVLDAIDEEIADERQPTSAK